MAKARRRSFAAKAGRLACAWQAKRPGTLPGLFLETVCAKRYLMILSAEPMISWETSSPMAVAALRFR